MYYTDDPDSVRPLTRAERDRLAIPVLGPLLRAPPLVVGGETNLDAPTPLQWQVLQESVVHHAERRRDDGSSNEMTTIDGAPIVALVDRATSEADVEGEFRLGIPSGRYATLAAVVGITGNSLGEFVEGSVRLVGIGRAILGDYYYKVPSQPSLAEEDVGDDDDDDDADEIYDLDNVPIIMAEFDLLHDTGVLGYHDWEFGKRSKKTSPVYALHLLHKASNKVGRIHDERLRLVAGLKAARARLDRVRFRTNDDDDDIEDYDGLGILSEGLYDDDDDADTEAEEDATLPESVMTVDEFLSAFARNDVTDANILDGPVPTSSSVAETDNYGVQYFAAFSTLARLTDEALISLDPYYSPAHKDREEYWYEVMSFVVWRALEGFVDEKDVAWALKCRNTVERLERACDVMLRHRFLLEELAAEISNELLECGDRKSVV